MFIFLWLVGITVLDFILFLSCLARLNRALLVNESCCSRLLLANDTFWGAMANDASSE